MSTSITKQGILLADGSNVGENLIAGTNPVTWHSLTLTDTRNRCISVFGDSVRSYLYLTDLGLSVGDTITVSFDIKFSNDITATGTGIKRSLFQGNYNNGGTYTSIGVTGGNQESVIADIIASDSKQGRIYTYFKITSAMINGTKSGKTSCNVRFDYYTGTVYVRATKVEKGTTATPWTPAPTDDIYVGDHGFFEGSDKGSIGKGYMEGNEFYEY